MKLPFSSLVLRASGLLPAVFMYASEAAHACGGSGGPNLFQVGLLTLATACCLFGTPFIAFGFINFLSGDTRGGALRVLTFIGAMGIVVTSIVVLEHTH
ncbi:MAG: hypothetical protein U0105_08470 [Candidatus Obscuribacterales bacterium]